MISGESYFFFLFSLFALCFFLMMLYAAPVSIIFVLLYKLSLFSFSLLGFFSLYFTLSCSCLRKRKPYRKESFSWKTFFKQIFLTESDTFLIRGITPYKDLKDIRLDVFCCFNRFIIPRKKRERWRENYNNFRSKTFNYEISYYFF